MLTTGNPQATLVQAEDAFRQVIEEVRQEELEEFILTEINQIFQYTRLYDQTFLQQSHLYRLNMVQQALYEFAHTHHLKSEALSQDEKAEVLRRLLSQLIKAPALFSNNDSVKTLSTEEIEYLILKQQYVERLPRAKVEDYFHRNYGIIITGGAYSRQLTNARKRLASSLRTAELYSRQASLK